MTERTFSWVNLGDYIQRIDERNSDNAIKEVKSVSVYKEFRDTGAKVDKNQLHNYKIVYPGDISFVQTTGNEKCLAAALSQFEYPIVVTSVNEVIRANINYLKPEYLMMFLLRKETDRYARFHSWGSARETFTWSDMCRVRFPLPSIEEQQKVVNAWKSLREIKEQNESIAVTLMQVCQSYIQELKHKYKNVEIGPYIEQGDLRNTEELYGVDLLRGVTSEGVFDYSKAKTDGIKFDNYKIVNFGDFAYNPSRINLGSIALCEMDRCIISPMYVVFRIKESAQGELLPEFLNLWFRRSEFQRSTLFFASGSVRDIFDFGEMQKVRIPLPPVEIQRSIVNLFNCANEAKKIAAEAERMSREVCPLLIQHVINN